MDDSETLADLAERGALSATPGTALRGEAAAAAGQAALMAATGTDSVTDARRVALGRPRLGSQGPSPVWRVRATSGMDEQVRDLADRRGVTISEVVREAVAAYLRTA